MLKKLFTIGMLVCAMTLTFGVNAQEGEKVYHPVYPNYSFWSNWHVGIAGEYHYEAHGFTDWRSGTNAGAMLFFEKDLNYVWAARLDLDYPSMWHNYDGQSFATGDYERIGKVAIDFKLSLNDWWRGYYNPDSRFSWYLLASLGAALDWDEYGIISLYDGIGTGISWDCCKHSTLFLEAVTGIVANPNNFFTGVFDHHDLTIRAGWMYDCGVTKADKERIAMRAMLTQENFDKLLAQNESLTKDLQNAKDREQKLINRINELEANQAANEARVIKTDDSRVADSLRRVIEGYEANKGNFYALPFSVTYAVDQYMVPEDQKGKVKAIADLMKSDDSFDIEVVGYCDASGPAAYNQKLSEKRAEQVKKLLVKYGVAEERITTVGKGQSASFGDLKNAINRRSSFYRVNK